MSKIEAARPPAALLEKWDLPSPFCIRVEVQDRHIDELNHTNNVHYLEWLQTCAWFHSKAVGLGAESMLATGCAMAVYQARLKYLMATHAGDVLWVGDWIVKNSKLRATRAFQILRESTGESADEVSCVMRAEIDYTSIHVESGRPRRMPAEFVMAYCVLDSTAEALASK